MFGITKTFQVHVALLWALVIGAPADAAPASPHGTLPLDAGWRFLKADAEGAEKPEFDDAGWRTVDLPHDWSIEGPFDEHNPAGGAGGFLPAGVGWYRKHFTLPPDDAPRRVFVEFDGVMANCDVWLNGEHLGKRPYGYVTVRYDLTGDVDFGAGKPNLLAVRADNAAQPASRWYSGAGIYRRVRLIVTDPIHVDTWGTFVSAHDIDTTHAAVEVRNAVVNQSDSPRRVAVRVTLLGPDGNSVQRADAPAQEVAPGKAVEFRQDLQVNAPQLWDLDRPNLYRAVVQVRDSETVLDETTTRFGIRQFDFKPETGFWLNGKNLKIKGVCLHEDGGAFGAAVPLGVWRHRLETLKSLGVNAIRTAHNPPDPAFLDLCDRMGLLVIDEMFDCWTVGKNKFDYHLYFDQWSKTDTRDTVRRDRNHPCVILYSAGNEIHDTPKADLAKRILGGLIDVFHENDPTRPVTQALFRPNASHDYGDGLADMLDVVGQNYREAELLAAHRQKPTRKIVGTENQHDLPVWLALRDHPEYSGQFLWTGIDYLGESRRWPVVGANSGLLDRTGQVRPIGYQRQSWWSDRPMVYAVRRVAGGKLSAEDPGYEKGAGFSPVRRPLVLFADWTPADLGPHEERVEVYSNCDRVELLLNGKSLGAQPKPADDAPRTWKVPFEAGTLKAVATRGGKEVATHELRTAGAPAKIVLAADRPSLAADWDDAVCVRATVTDANGVPVPTASDEIVFSVTRPGVIAAVDNGDNSSHEPFQADRRHAYLGRCVAFVKATGNAGGKITVDASAPGLAGGSITLDTPAPAAPPAGGRP